jgi:hypothetical protein
MRLAALIIAIMALVQASAKDVPFISQDFTVNTREEDSDGNTIVEQRLVWDATLRRSLMHAKGSLVKGAMEQIKRCDLIPEEGWFTNAGGPNANDGTHWQCTNTTITPRGELPTHCVYNNFFAISGSINPPVYAGVEAVNGVQCDKWTYEMADGSGGVGKYAFWCVEDQPIPAASSELGRYSIYFSDFVAGSPAVSEFEPESNYNCPNATPASMQDNDERLEAQALHNMIKRVTK